MMASLGCCASCGAGLCCNTVTTIFKCTGRFAKKSTRVRLQYYFQFISVAFVAWLLRDYGYDVLKRYGPMDQCSDDVCTGRGVVLRFCLAMVLTSSVLCILLYRVKTSQEPRAFLQNEFFPLKWLILGGVIVGCVWIDNSTISNFSYAAAVLSGLFIFIGIAILLEWAHSWNDSWVRKADDGSKEWAYLILFVAFVLLAGSVVMWWVLYHYFGGSGCTETNAFVSVTVVLSVVLTFMSILNVIQGALLPSAVMVAYATYLCTVAVFNIPIDDTSACAGRHDPAGYSGRSGLYAVGVIITILATGFATIRAATYGESLDPAERAAALEKGKGDGAAITADNDGDKGVEEDETEATEYNYSFFHFMYALGAMHLAMVLNEWQLSIEVSGTVAANNPWTSTWVNIGSQWAVFALYFWSLIAPLVCRGRDFS